MTTPTQLCTKHAHVTNMGVRCHYCEKEEREQSGSTDRLKQHTTTRGDGRLRILVPLATGEIDMIRRALRVWAHCEQEAMQTAACSRDPVHAADVRRQVLPRIAAAGVLMDRLLKDPVLQAMVDDGIPF